MAVLESVEDPSKRERLFDTSKRLQFLLYGIEEVIVGYASELTSIVDGDIHEAIVALRSTYQTEEKGVIYEHASSNPLAQALVREIQDYLERQRAESIDQGTSLRTADLLACLEFLEVDVAFHLAADPVSESYLQFIARNHPELAVKEDSGRIILAP
jgi:hypothetical protein